MYTCGGYLVGHQALVCGVECRDGSLWQWSGGDVVTVLAPIDGHSWFGYGLWMKSALTVDGVEQPVAEDGAVSLRAEHTGPHRIAASDWSMEIEVDAGSVVRISERGRPGDHLTLSTDDSGFASGSVALDGGDAQPLVLDGVQQPWRAESIDIRLLSKGGHEARVKVARKDGPSLMLRVSRER